MTTLTFKQYVLSHSPEDSPAGDFIMDAKHPQSTMPDVKSWRELERWLVSIGGHVQLAGAKEVWQRFEAARDPIEMPIAMGYTVEGLMSLLAKEDPKAHVIKYHRGRDVTASRVESFSKVTIDVKGRKYAAIMLE
jgi:hypothetical protein